MLEKLKHYGSCVPESLGLACFLYCTSSALKITRPAISKYSAHFFCLSSSRALIGCSTAHRSSQTFCSVSSQYETFAQKELKMLERIWFCRKWKSNRKLLCLISPTSAGSTSQLLSRTVPPALVRIPWGRNYILMTSFLHLNLRLNKHS